MSAYLFYKLALIAPTWVGSIMAVASGSASEGGEDHSGPPHLPSLVGMIFGNEGVAHHWIDIEYALFISVIFSVVSIRVYAKRQMIPGALQNVLEMMVEGMYNFIYTILGEDTKKYIPYLGTLFFYILAMNLMGIIPGGHSPSTSLNITGSLAVMTFLYAQYTVATRLGLKKWAMHMIGDPKDVAGWSICWLILIIHLVGEVAKPASLALRLFGNITGEDVLVAAFVGLGITALAFIGSPIGLPLNIPFILLGILLSTIQALVFTLLSTIYILMMLPHEEEHH